MNHFIASQDWFANLFSASNLQIMLLIGSGILAISLLVLAMTRWGHSRPVWKCVILSFVAHILLMGYAYGTRMIFEAPTAVKQDSPMRVNFVEESGLSTEGDEEFDSSKKQWDQFVDHQALPSLEGLERPEIDSEVVIGRTFDRTVEKPTVVAPEPDLATLPKPSEALEISAPDSVDDFQPVAEELAPEQIELARVGDGDSNRDTPGFELPDEFERPEMSNDIAESATEGVEPPVNDFVQDQKDNSFVTDFKDKAGEFPIAATELPKPVITPQYEPVQAARPAPRKTSSQLQVVSNPRRIADGQPLPKMYSLRRADNRLVVAKQRGGSIDTERAVELALQWLAANQEKDGSWDPQKSGAGNESQVFGHDRGGAGAQANTGITGLATLAFLAAGQSHFEGQYQDEVQIGLEYLARQQKSNGDLSGNARLFAKMYCHSMSLLALSEALAMTGDKRLLPVVQRGVDYSIMAQNRRDGGWRYQPGDSGDMSQFGWQVLALHSAKLGGASVPQASFERMHQFLDRCTSGIGKGLASYKPNQGPSTTMTAEALLCRYILGQQVKSDTVMQATRRISSERPTPRHVNLYYWYYGTLAMYHAGGSDWENWNSELKTTLLQLQNVRGENKGSYPPNGVWGGYGGRVYSTAMATLNLEVYYRYLPIYQEIAEAQGMQPLRNR